MRHADLCHYVAISSSTMFFLILSVVLALLAYLYLVRPFSYWHKKNVKSIKPIPLFGNLLSNVLQKEAFSHLSQRIYNSAPNERYVGYYEFLTPILILRDPELIKQITVKDFDVFPDHRQFIRDDVDPLWSKNLFSMRGETWKAMRPTLSPSFTSSKMRAMFTLMAECAEQFVQYFLKQDEELHVVEVKDIFTRYTNDVIATCAFGVKCDSLTHKTNEFYLRGKDASDFSGFKSLRFLLNSVSPELMKLMNVKVFSQATSTFFRTVVMDTIKMREEKGIIRPDMIHLLMEARKGKLKLEDAKIDTGFATVEESEYGKSNGAKTLELSEDEIVAQALIFFLAGFDTASTLMCFLAYELAVNPDVQAKVFDEIQATIKETKGDITYEALLGMKYLDMVISETLRKWPPTPTMDRKSIRPYTIPPVNPGEEPLHLPTGSVIFLPMYPMHRDPRFYPDPDKFDPERFSDENKHKINPFAYIPFGSGPRNCIGSRFALLENKTIIFNILRHFELVPVEKTPIPMVLSTKQFTLATQDGMWLGLKIRKASASK